MVLAILSNGRNCHVNSFLQADSLKFALPYDDDRPTFSFELAPDILVALLISGYFGRPIVSISIGRVTIFTSFVTMPKTAVNKNGSTIFWKDDIRFARQLLIVHLITEPQVPEGIT